MPPEIFDPKNRELKYYNDPNREKKFKPRKRIYRMFATKRFMLSYGVFLTVAVICVYAFQNGGINNIPVLSRIFGDGLKIQTTIVDQDINKKYVFVLIENKRYKNNTILSLKSQATFYNKDEELASNEVHYNVVMFDDDKLIKLAIEFEPKNIENATRYIVETDIDGKIIVNKKEL